LLPGRAADEIEMMRDLYRTSLEKQEDPLLRLNSDINRDLNENPDSVELEKLLRASLRSNRASLSDEPTPPATAAQVEQSRSDTDELQHER
jgi:hypothetical protein